MNKNLIEKIAPQLTELMIKKMETLTEEWRKPWIADLAHGLPRNLRGTPYRGGNTLMLLFLSEIAGYSTPLFMTFKQAKEEGLNILKGSGSFPVFFWKLYIRHKETRKKIELADYYRLPQEQRRQYDVLPVMRYYPVFNIDQTDMSEQQPERYTSLTTPTGPKDYSDGLTCEPLDRMLAEQSWLPSCSDPATGRPIHRRSIGSSAPKNGSSRRARHSTRHFSTKSRTVRGMRSV